jgi:hypothetical protein
VVSGFVEVEGRQMGADACNLLYEADEFSKKRDRSQPQREGILM